MTRRRWLLHLVIRGILYRKGRSLLLLAVLAMASSLVTSMGIVSISMDKRVAEEVKKYGANLVILPESARIDVGSGGLNFGIVAEPAYLDQETLGRILDQQGIAGAAQSLHLRGTLQRGDAAIIVEGVNFEEIGRLFPWWQLQGRWPTAGEAIIGSDLAASQRLKVGDTVDLAGPAGGGTFRVAAVVTTGGEEERQMFVDLAAMQKVLGLPDRLSQVRLLVPAGGESLAGIAAGLQKSIPGARVMEVRQVARTSEALLQKVQLLMLLVTVVVVVAAAGSVAGTMSTTVLERGKEIGLMKAMGGSRREVLLIFSAEALLLGLLGGLAGFLAGNGIALLVVQTVFAVNTAFLPFFLPVALASSLFLALLASIGPLLSVFRLDPVRSLRGE